MRSPRIAAVLAAAAMAVPAGAGAITVGPVEVEIPPVGPICGAAGLPACDAVDDILDQVDAVEVLPPQSGPNPGPGPGPGPNPPPPVDPAPPSVTPDPGPGAAPAPATTPGSQAGGGTGAADPGPPAGPTAALGSIPRGRLLGQARVSESVPPQAPRAPTALTDAVGAAAEFVAGNPLLAGLVFVAALAAGVDLARRRSRALAT